MSTFSVVPALRSAISSAVPALMVPVLVSVPLTRNLAVPVSAVTMPPLVRPVDVMLTFAAFMADAASRLVTLPAAVTPSVWPAWSTPLPVLATLPDAVTPRSLLA